MIADTPRGIVVCRECWVWPTMFEGLTASEESTGICDYSFGDAYVTAYRLSPSRCTWSDAHFERYRDERHKLAVAGLILPALASF